MKRRASSATSTTLNKDDSDEIRADDVASVGLDPLDRLVGYKLRRAQLVTFREFIRRFQALKLRPAEFAVLTILESNPGLKQTEAAEMLGIKRANFVALMDQLERRGLAERRISGSDRRSYALFLTSKGSRVCQKASCISERFEEALAARLGGTAGRETLLNLLDRLIRDDGM